MTADGGSRTVSKGFELQTPTRTLTVRVRFHWGSVGGTLVDGTLNVGWSSHTMSTVRSVRERVYNTSVQRLPTSPCQRTTGLLRSTGCLCGGPVSCHPRGSSVLTEA